MAQIIRITSEALQATIRRLLPSQQGFGEDLQASNIIQPIIDLTPTAEGSQLPFDLARSASFGAISAYETTNGTSTLASTPGFYRIQGVSTIETDTAQAGVNKFNLVSNLTTRSVWQHGVLGAAASEITQVCVDFDFIVFLDTGVTFQAVAPGVGRMFTTIWNVADRYGNTTNPSGFTFE